MNKKLGVILLFIFNAEYMHMYIRCMFIYRFSTILCETGNSNLELSEPRSGMSSELEQLHKSVTNGAGN
jgi:hypothetical protein